MPFGNGLSVQDRNLLSRATSQNSDPTPGHLYKEISDLVKHNFNNLSSVEDYLLSRVSRPEPYIKFKCIKLLKYLVTQFPQYINITKITSHSALLECRGYRCNYSEYNGDYLSNLIRTETTEFFQQVANMANALHGDKSFGFGNNLHIGNPKMEGFGNTALNVQQHSSNSIPAPLKALSNIASRYLSSSVVETIEQVGSCITTSAMEQIEKHIGFGTKKQQFSQVPTFKHTPPVFRPQTQPSLLPNLLEVPSSSNSLSNSHDSSNAAGTRTGAFQGNSEMKLVNDFLTFSGIKVTPSQHVLDDFTSRLQLLDATLVIEELLRRLNTRSLKWQVHLRILCVLDALVRRGDLSGDIVEELKKQLAPMLVICKESPQLKNKCIRLESLLKINGGHGDDVLGVDLIGVGVSGACGRANVAATSASSRLDKDSRVTSIESQFDDFTDGGKAKIEKQGSADSRAEVLDDFIGGVAARDVLDLSWQASVSGDSTRATATASAAVAAETSTTAPGAATSTTTSGDAFENLFDSLTLLAPPEPLKASTAAPTTSATTFPATDSNTWNPTQPSSAQPSAPTAAASNQSQAPLQTFQPQSDAFDPFGTPKNLNAIQTANSTQQMQTDGKSYTVDDLI